MTRPDATAELRAIRLEVERLVALVQRLGEENRSLRHAQEQLVAERATLVAKSEQARSRVEAMIARLKSLEQNG
jgi:cell division protein ZapB